MKHWQRWLMRAVLGFSLALNARTALTADPWWLTMLALATILFVSLCWWSAERSFREADAIVEDVWRKAAESEDPIGFMAGYSYLRSLSMQQKREFGDALSEWEPGEEPPAIVAGFFDATNNPPREAV